MLNAKKSRFLKIAIISTLVFSLTSTILSFAATKWREEGNTINKVDVAEVRGVINEVYEGNVTVYPGETVKKEVSVQNTGTVPAITRVSVDIQWDDNTLSTDSISINFNSKNWLQKDGFYYYKGILAPSEETPLLMDKFTLDAVSVNNEYANKKGRIIVDMEMLQAGGGAEEMWGITHEELGIADDAEAITLATNDIFATSVEFNGHGRGFSFSANAGDLFALYKNMVPGETISQFTTVTNNSNETVEIFLTSMPNTNAGDTASDISAESILRQYSLFIIQDTSGAEIYRGTLLPEKENSANSQISLGIFSPNETKKLNMTLCLSPEMDNAYRAATASLVWCFSCEGEITELPIPATGDKVRLWPFVISAVAAAVVFAVCVFKGKKEKCI